MNCKPFRDVEARFMLKFEVATEDFGRRQSSPCKGAEFAWLGFGAGGVCGWKGVRVEV